MKTEPKCNSFCKAKISPRYFLIELSFLLGFLLVYFALQMPINLVFLLYLAICAILLCMIIIDLEHYFIPNSLQYFLAFFVLILLFNLGGEKLILSNLKAAFLYLFFAIFLKIFFYFLAKTDALGIDDVKFFFVAGLLLGEKNFLIFTLFSGIFGIIFGAIWQKLKNDDTFPFAPAICTSCFVAMIFGKKLDAATLLGSLIFL
jgi:leader peptidase (prepilin peptidase)/N-methyltransferase